MGKPVWWLLAAVVGFIALVCAAPAALAAGSVAGIDTFMFSCSGPRGTFTEASAFAACSQAVNRSSSYQGATDTFSVTTCSGPDNASCTIQRDSCNGLGSCQTYYEYISATKVPERTCPTHSSKGSDGLTCFCEGGFKPNEAGTACVPDCTAKQTVSSGYFDIGPSAGATPQLLACSGNCSAVFDGTSPAGSSMVGGVKHWFAKGEYITTGGPCTPGMESKQVSSGSGTSKLPDATCGANQGSATMNGKTVCVDQGGDGKTPTDASKNQASSDTQKTKVTNPDGSTTETEVRTRVDANGNKETTTTTTTTRPDGSSTTTRQVDNPLPGSVLGGGNGSSNGSGSGTGTGTGNEGEGEEQGPCQKNPSEAGCGGDPATIGQLYTEKGKTLSSVLGAARDNFMASPIGTAVGGFFVVSNPGACPTFSGHIPFINADLQIDQFCTPFATQALLVLKMAVILVCAFFAFRAAVE